METALNRIDELNYEFSTVSIKAEKPESGVVYEATGAATDDQYRR